MEQRITSIAFEQITSWALGVGELSVFYIIFCLATLAECVAFCGDYGHWLYGTALDGVSQLRELLVT